MLPRIHQVAHVRLRYRSVPTDQSDVHATHVLSCHVRAEGVMTYGAEELVARAPYLCLLPAGERDRNRFSGPFEGWWCLFDYEMIRSTGGRTVSLVTPSSTIQRSHCRQLNAEESRTVIGLFHDLSASARIPDAASNVRSAARLLDLLSWWADSPRAADGGSTPAEAFRTLIIRHACNPDLSLDVLATKVGFRLTPLGAAFAREYGMTPIEFRTHLRLNRARELLLATTWSIAQVAREVGVTDPDYFARVFRKTYGITPKRYARENALNVAIDK